MLTSLLITLIFGESCCKIIIFFGKHADLFDLLDNVMCFNRLQWSHFYAMFFKNLLF
jgi:hypothetical protein